MKRVHGTPELRLWRRVARGEGCWDWTGYRNAKGYGVIGTAGGRNMLTHRLAWEITYGPIPVGLYVCHRCHNRACVRPDHLYVGTQSDNMRDASQAGRLWNQQPGRMPKGDANWNTIIPDAVVLKMRAIYAEGQLSQDRVADLFGVPRKPAQGLISGRARKHLPVPQYNPRPRLLRNPSAKLDETQIAQIVERYSRGESSLKLGRDFGVHHASIHKIIKRAGGTSTLRARYRE